MSKELREAKAREVETLAVELDRVRKAKAEANRTGGDKAELRDQVARIEVALEAAKIAFAIAEQRGGEHGVVAMGDDVVGTVALRIDPGTERDARMRAIDDALAPGLEDLAREIGGVLAAAPHRYTRERPGRDAEGRTVLDVRGRLEGDRVVPAIAPTKRG